MPKHGKRYNELVKSVDRKQAYENLALRTNLEGVKSVCMALQQSERYGTPLGQTLRVMSQENRDMRMSEAEKKAERKSPRSRLTHCQVGTTVGPV